MVKFLWPEHDKYIIRTPFTIWGGKRISLTPRMISSQNFFKIGIVRGIFSASSIIITRLIDVNLVSENVYCPNNVGISGRSKSLSECANRCKQKLRSSFEGYFYYERKQYSNNDGHFCACPKASCDVLALHFDKYFDLYKTADSELIILHVLPTITYVVFAQVLYSKIIISV